MMLACLVGHTMLAEDASGLFLDADYRPVCLDGLDHPTRVANDDTSRGDVFRYDCPCTNCRSRA